MSSLRVLAGFLKMIRADRALGAATERDSVAFEQLYQRCEDPWGPAVVTIHPVTVPCAAGADRGVHAVSDLAPPSQRS